MPRLKKLSGDEVISVLVSFGFKIHSQRGSHVKLRRTAGGRNTEILTVPRHSELDMGTLHAIFRQACRFVPEDDLRKAFYTD